MSQIQPFPEMPMPPPLKDSGNPERFTTLIERFILALYAFVAQLNADFIPKFNALIPKINAVEGQSATAAQAAATASDAATSATASKNAAAMSATNAANSAAAAQESAAIAQQAEGTITEGATYEATPYKVAKRNEAGRLQVEAPAAPKDAVNMGWVDLEIAGALTDLSMNPGVAKAWANIDRYGAVQDSFNLVTASRDTTLTNYTLVFQPGIIPNKSIVFVNALGWSINAGAPMVDAANNRVHIMLVDSTGVQVFHDFHIIVFGS